MENLDFLTVGIVICIVLELFGHGLDYRKNIKQHFKYSNKYITYNMNVECIGDLFMIFFYIYLLFTPMWLVGIVLWVVSIVFNSSVKPHSKEWNEHVSSGMPLDDPKLKYIEDKVIAYKIVDTCVTVLVLVWGLTEHLNLI